MASCRAGAYHGFVRDELYKRIIVAGLIVFGLGAVHAALTVVRDGYLRVGGVVIMSAGAVAMIVGALIGAWARGRRLDA